jgi:prepilin-type N-terminal cleavage/methylation domain-containing protein/prepilin-type processing-associated H-X9-DG protein
MLTAQRRAFTLVEMLVVVAIIGLLLAMVFPAMKRVKESAGETTCASNLKQLGAATFAYLAVYKDHLPQMVALNPFSGQQEVIGTLFGGKRGQLAMFGVDQFGADARPLNKFLGSGAVLVDTDPSDGIDEDLPVFRCPMDRGQPAQPPFLPEVESMYDFVGSSYTLNDHALTSEDCATLVPKRSGSKPGGKMPSVEDPTKTWMIGDLPIYNFQEGGDRGQKWHMGQHRCNLCFVDGHVDAGVKIVEGIVDTTPDYTFLPSKDWFNPLHNPCPPVSP